MKAIKEIVRTLVIISVIWLLLFTSGYSAESKIQTGATGVSGLNGTNGLDGTNGTNGTNGINGRNGTDGLDGENITWLIEGASQIIFRNVSCAKNQRIVSLDATVENHSVAYLDFICENI